MTLDKGVCVGVHTRVCVCMGMGVYTCVQSATQANTHVDLPTFPYVWWHTQFVLPSDQFHKCVVTISEMTSANLPENSENFGLFLDVLSLSASVATVGSDSFLGLCHHVI